MDLVLFYLFAALTVAASLAVILRRNPMHSVLLLILSFVGLAGLYILLDSPFAAVTQIIVYAGAIMVLFLFVVMLLNVSREQAPGEENGRPFVPTGPRRAGAALAMVFLAELGWALSRVARSTSGPGRKSCFPAPASACAWTATPSRTPACARRSGSSSAAPRSSASGSPRGARSRRRSWPRS